MPRASHLARDRHQAVRRPEKTPLFEIVSEFLESWLEERSAREQHGEAHVEEEFRGCLTCGLLCF